MKLYYFPGACSLSPHIVARELGIDLALERVDIMGSKKTAADADYLAVNPKGYVPALQLDDGSVLTEGPAIVQYLADLRPEKKLAPENGTLARYRLQEWLNFITAELHKNFSPLFVPGTSEERRQEVFATLRRRIPVVARPLDSQPYLLGDDFSVADVYLFVVLSWSQYVNFDLTPWPSVQRFLERVGGRPSVQAARAAEAGGK